MLKTQVVDKTNLMSVFKTGVLVKSSLKEQSYSFSVGSESRIVETIGVSFKSDNIKDRVELIKQYFIDGYNIVLCGKPNTHLFITV